MPPEIYAQVLDHVHRVLRKYYSHVDSAIEAPEKETYGDVDTLVYGPFDPTWDDLGKGSPEVAETLAQALGAKKFVRQNGNSTVNYAIPWPGQDDDKGRDHKYAQLDVCACFSLESFKWDLFHLAHGDLWNIIGSTIRPFGLTVNDKGMYLRIPEIDLYNRKKSMVFLTSNPREVLRFLCLDEERWFKQFESKQEMFQYATRCRLFWVKELGDTSEAECGAAGDPPTSVDDNPATVKKDIGGQEGGERGKKVLKANDRRRMAQRPIFREWIDEFIPRCRERGIFGDARTTREQIRQDAFDQFGVKEEYEARLKEWAIMKNEEDLWRVVIKGSVPVDNVDPAFRAAAIRTLKAAIVEFDGVARPRATVKDQEGFYDLEVARRFVLENWEKAGRAGLARQDLKAMEAMRAKAEKREREANDGKRKDAPT
jgi:hypothetical protein